MYLWLEEFQSSLYVEKDYYRQGQSRNIKTRLFALRPDINNNKKVLYYPFYHAGIKVNLLKDLVI